MSEEECKYWVVCDLSYEETMKLAASDLIKNFQRNPNKNEAKFWPGSKGVWQYLNEHAPQMSAILNDTGHAVRFERETRELKTFPVRRPAKMGMEIPHE